MCTTLPLYAHVLDFRNFIGGRFEVRTSPAYLLLYSALTRVLTLVLTPPTLPYPQQSLQDAADDADEQSALWAALLVLCDAGGDHLVIGAHDWGAVLRGREHHRSEGVSVGGRRSVVIRFVGGHLLSQTQLALLALRMATWSM